MLGEVERTMRLHCMNRPIKRSTITILSGAALLFAACDQAVERAVPTASPSVVGPQADLTAVQALMQQLLASEPLIPDGSLTLDDPLPPGHTIHVVTHDNQGGWKIQVSATGAVTFDNETTCDPDQPPPLPPGALHLMVAPEPDAELTSARLRSTRYHRTYLRDLSRLDYYTCDEENNVQQWPFIVLEIDQNGDNVIDDQLIFEPAYQNLVDGGVCGLASNQAKPMLNKWQFWDALRTDPTTGDFRTCWWSVEEMVAFPPGFTIRSLSEYIAVHPNAAIVNLDGNHGGIQIMHGFSDPNDTYNGWVDAFTIGKDINGSNGQTQNSTITYDFERR
jgi:hypothetical protein